MHKLSLIMNLLRVKEEDVIKALLNLVSPPPPPATRQNWSRLSTFGNNAPSTKDLWRKLVDSDFKCHKCGSQMRLSFNHIDGNAKNHDLQNLEVICFACNRRVSKKGTLDENQHYKLAMATFDLWNETKCLPTLEQIRIKAGVKQIGGATYLLKYILARLENQK
jgi:hypothetical protein